MKIALPTKDNQIDGHFGHCEYFTVFTVDTVKKSILLTEKLQSPEGCGCKSNISSTLKDHGVTLMLAGNMGEGAVRVLNNAGIEVIRGCSGSIDTVAKEWLQNNISDSGIACTDHDCH